MEGKKNFFMEHKHAFITGGIIAGAVLTGGIVGIIGLAKLNSTTPALNDPEDDEDDIVDVEEDDIDIDEGTVDIDEE